ncbi:beta-defensin 5 [Pelodiscus sinensis]|uniref:beta-defensin 5 n=1 Tax=Pelodiscus sinensis TaxID=13735 RepID=UPI003F6D0AAC
MKMLHLLFAVFLLVLQSAPGRTHCPPVNVKQCVHSGGMCYGVCSPPFTDFGSCGMGISCCKWLIQEVSDQTGKKVPPQSPCKSDPEKFCYQEKKC